MLTELSKKLQDKFDFSEDHFQAVVYEVRRFAKQVEISGTIKAVAADPDDDKFIECALLGKAKVIVSGDHHLLDLGQYEDIPIMNPAEFVAWIASHLITEVQSG
jgi:predicted nucleic acid-binding protein